MGGRPAGTSEEKVLIAQRQVLETGGLMESNIDAVLQRGERLDALDERAARRARLEDATRQFERVRDRGPGKTRGFGLGGVMDVLKNVFSPTKVTRLDVVCLLVYWC